MLQYQEKGLLKAKKTKKKKYRRGIGYEE